MNQDPVELATVKQTEDEEYEISQDLADPDGISISVNFLSNKTRIDRLEKIIKFVKRIRFYAH